jgi:hypothetical protein
MRTVDKLRTDIDSGRTGDKVPAVDPAAAPLGTDDEAAGFPPTAEAIALALRHETSGPHDIRPQRGLGHAWILVAFILLFAVALFAMGWFGRAA